MPELFESVFEAVESSSWNFGLLCSFFGVDESDMEEILDCRDEYGLLGYLEIDLGLS